MPADPYAEELINVLKQLNQPVQDTDDCGKFCESIAVKMRRFTPYQQGIAQQRILDIMFNIEHNPSHHSLHNQAPNTAPSTTPNPTHNIPQQSPVATISSSTNRKRHLA